MVFVNAALNYFLRRLNGAGIILSVVNAGRFRGVCGETFCRADSRWRGRFAGRHDIGSPASLAGECIGVARFPLRSGRVVLDSKQQSSRRGRGIRCPSAVVASSLLNQLRCQSRGLQRFGFDRLGPNCLCLQHLGFRRGGGVFGSRSGQLLLVAGGGSSLRVDVRRWRRRLIFVGR